MASDYITQWDLNGDVYDIHDSDRGLPNGVATLDENSRIPVSQLPDSAVTTKPFLSAIFGHMLGRSWKRASGLSSTAREIVYANGLYVAATSSGLWWADKSSIWSWHQGTGTTVSFNSLIYANNIWVAVSGSNGLWYSEDGKAWTQVSNTAEYSMQGLTFADDMFIAGSAAHGLWWSEDGISWTQGTGDNTSYNMVAPIYAEGIWVSNSISLSSSTSYHGVWWSEDGKDWHQGTGDNSDKSVSAIRYANGVWHAVGSVYCYSTDGKVWTACTGDSMNNSGVPVYGNGRWVAEYGGRAYYSLDGIAWTAVDIDTMGTSYSRKIFYANGLFLIMLYISSAHKTYIYSSVDGVNWLKSEDIKDSANEDPAYYAYINDLYVCAHGSGIAYSEDGITWLKGYTSANACKCVTQKNGVWLVGHSAGIDYCDLDSIQHYLELGNVIIQ